MRSPHLLLSILCLVLTCAADAFNVVFLERSLAMNVTNTSSSNTGKLNLATSYLTTSQDFQGIQIESSTSSPPNRVVFNFGEVCQTSNTTMDYIQTLNNNSILAGGILYSQKIALVKRGNCNWSEKLTTVQDLSNANNLHVTAMVVYDNESYANISIERTYVYGTASVDTPEYSTPLPAERNVVNMSDNDLLFSSNSKTSVYFIPLVYGELFIQRLNDSFNPNNPTLRDYWMLSPLAIDPNQNSPSRDGFFGEGRAYISYIIALGAIFVIGVIFLRWWKIRRMRHDSPDGITTPNVFGMHPRVNRADPLPVDVVNSIPIAKYAEDLVKNVNCAICLEDFVPGKHDIRILPCAHGFCVLCIDPWLTQKSCMCPICKWDCLPADLRCERNELLQRERSAPQTATTNNETQTDDNSTVIEIPPSTFASTSTEFQPTEDTPPIVSTTAKTTTPNLTDNDRPQLENIFTSNDSSVNRDSEGSSHPVRTDVEMTSEKKSSPKN